MTQRHCTCGHELFRVPRTDNTPSGFASLTPCHNDCDHTSLYPSLEAYIGPPISPGTDPYQETERRLMPWTHT